MTTSALIAELERLDREATPGPWHAEQDGERAYLTRGPIEYETGYIKRADWLADFEREDAPEEENVNNAIVAATLRNSLPRIIALLKAGHELAIDLQSEHGGCDAPKCWSCSMLAAWREAAK